MTAIELLEKIYSYIFSYITISINLLLSPSKSIEVLSKNNQKPLCNDNIFFATNIILMQLVLLANERISRFYFYEPNINTLSLMLPILGSTHINYIFKIISIYIGSAIIIYIILKNTGLKTKNYMAIKRVIFYSSIYWVIISLIGAILEIIFCVLIEITVFNGFDMHEIVTNFLQVESFQYLLNFFKYSIIIAILFSALKSTVYVILIINLLKCTSIKDNINISKICKTFLSIFLVSTFLFSIKPYIIYSSMAMTYANISYIKSSANLINARRQIMYCEAILHNQSTEDSKNILKNKDYIENREELILCFRELSHDNILPASEKYNFYIELFLLSNMDMLLEKSNENSYIVFNRIINGENKYINKYKNIISKDNVNSDIELEIKSLEKERNEEAERYKGKLPAEIFAHKLMLNSGQLIPIVHILYSLITIFPL